MRHKAYLRSNLFCTCHCKYTKTFSKNKMSMSNLPIFLQSFADWSCFPLSPSLVIIGQTHTHMSESDESKMYVWRPIQTKDSWREKTTTNILQLHQTACNHHSHHCHLFLQRFCLVTNLWWCELTLSVWRGELVVLMHHRKT